MRRRLLGHVATGWGIAAAAAMLGGCASEGAGRDLPPVSLVAQLDLPRFMGDWYVIASIPTRFEKGAHNAKESYRLDPDGTIDTTFTFRSDSFAGPVHEFRSRGFVLAPSNAVWGEQYVWPFKADYRVSYVADDYSQTVITRAKRDWVWIMARTPTIAEADYQRLLAIVAREGYDPAKVERVPQQEEARR